MIVEKTELPDLLVLTPKRFGDARGFFCESWNRRRMEAHGIDLDFVQDNHSLSEEAGTIRGLHYQSPPHAQDKLVRCGRGRLFDVAVDARVGSPTYGASFGIELSFENGRQLLVPKGFLHGFVTREAGTEIIYKCTDYYAPECDGSVHFADPELNIEWGIDPENAVLSDKDASAASFSDFRSPFRYEDLRP